MLRFFSLLLVICLVFTIFCSFCFASVPALPGDVTSPLIVPVSVADWAWNKVAELGDMAGSQIAYWINNDVCPSTSSPNNRHDFVVQDTLVNGQRSNYYVCKYCGHSTGEIFDDTYSDYVSDLPASSLNSDGSLVWSPTFDDVTRYELYCSHYYYTANRLPYVYSGDYAACSYAPIGNSCVLGVITVKPQDSGSSSSTMYLTFKFPLSGVYTTLNKIKSESDFADTTYYSDSAYTKTAGQVERILIGGKSVSFSGTNAVYKTYLYLPSFSVIPFDGLIDPRSDNTYNIDSRPTSISGDLAYYNTSGDLILAPVTSIVNEDNHSVYNPVTDTTYDMSSWNYDYSDRSYNVTTTTGDTVTVTYGDQNITINEGGDTYNIYYVMEYQEPPHEHTYSSEITTIATCTGPGLVTFTCVNCGDVYTQELQPIGHTYGHEVTKEPTCTLPGEMTMTCINCGDVYIDAVPARGHTWELKIEAPTEYDANGELVRTGYRIYKCSVCGEENRVDYESGPPALPSPTPVPDEPVEYELPSGWDSFRDTLLSFFTTLPEIFSDFTSFLAAAFSYIPPDILHLVEFGVAMAVLVGLFKLFFR